MEKISISVVIITKNEEHNLTDCLKSAAWAEEIIVVDGHSTDKTQEIARSFGAKVFEREMDIEGRHRNFAYAQATQDWILSLDADERVSPQLASEIAAVIKENSSEIVGYAIPVKTFIGERWIKAAGYYPARKLRMHRKGKFRYEETSVHPRAFLDGKEKPLRGDILHYGLRDFAHFIEKLNNQTTLEAQKWIQEGRRVTWFKAMHKSLDRFFRNYIGKKGYSDGFLGFMMSVFHGLYQLFSYAKYVELKRAKN